MTAPLHLTLSSPLETAALARHMAGQLHAGDCLLLDGPIGAGKTHFARSLIQHLMGDAAEDVPSPTFTLVQTYEAGPLEIWHADLYRLTHPDEVAELGLIDAFETALCLVEWPDRLVRLAPADALRLTFAHGDTPDARSLALSADAPRWGALFEALQHA